MGAETFVYKGLTQQRKTMTEWRGSVVYNRMHAKTPSILPTYLPYFLNKCNQAEQWREVLGQDFVSFLVRNSVTARMGSLRANYL